MKNGRRKFLGDDKMAILRRHLVDKVSVSDVCDQMGIHPTLFYRRQKELFDRGSAAFDRRGDDGRQRSTEEREKRRLEKKVAIPSSLPASFCAMQSHVELKKSLGEI